jgi:glutamine synthetase type III
LLSGRGEMLRNIVNQDKLYVTALENEIRNLKETVRSYEAELHHKNREILDKNELLKQKDATITIHEKVIIAQEKTIASQELLMGKMIDKEIIPPLIDQAIENDYFGISTNAN